MLKLPRRRPPLEHGGTRRNKCKSVRIRPEGARIAFWRGTEGLTAASSSRTLDVNSWFTYYEPMVHDQAEALHSQLLEYEQRGLVRRTFRRLDPDRQRAVLDAILEEARAVGPTSLNIKRVAERAGVAVGSLYQYFGRRELLLEFASALSVQTITELFRQGESFLAELPLRQGLQAYLMTGVALSDTQAGLVAYLARAAYGGDESLAKTVVRPVAETMLGMVRAMLEAGLERGEVSPELDLEATSRVVHTQLAAISDAVLVPHLNEYFQITTPEVQFERAVDAAVELLVRGLAPRGGER